MSCALTIPNASPSENAFFVGINLQDILYGVQLVLYFKTMRILVGRRKERRKSDLFYAAFSTVMHLLITIWVTCKALFGQMMWLLDANYPGGPLAFAETHMSDTIMNAAKTAVIILQQMTNGFMVYRCRIVWKSTKIAIVPFILWLTSLSLGILASLDGAAPDDTPFSGVTTKLGLVYSAVSVLLNATLTCMICYRWRKEESLEAASTSLSCGVVRGLVVESMLPYTLSGIAFMISYGVGSGTEVAFSCVYTLMMCMSPQMLILRLVEGRGWRQDRIVRPPVSTIMFSPDSGGTTSGGDGFDESGAHLEMKPISKSSLDFKV